MSAKPVYGPVPVRAFGDPELEGADFRVLGIIAAHDRLNANGSGCYANHKRLAGMVGIHFVTFSKSVAKLGKRGYLTSEVHPLNRRLRVYRVIYTDDDRAMMTARDDGTVSPQANDCPDDDAGKSLADWERGANSAAIVSPQANHAAATVSVENPEASEIRRDSPANIFCEAENTSSRSYRIHSSEEAPHSGGGGLEDGTENVGAFLAITTRRLRSGNVPDSELEALRDRLEAIAIEAEHDDPLGHWAERLGETVLERLGFYGPVEAAR